MLLPFRDTAVVNFPNILRTAFAPIFLPQKITNPNCTVTRKKLRKTLLYKKGLHKMLMKLTPGG